VHVPGRAGGGAVAGEFVAHGAEKNRILSMRCIARACEDLA
jgi:hypothetical protein